VAAWAAPSAAVVPAAAEDALAAALAAVAPWAAVVVPAAALAEAAAEDADNRNLSQKAALTRRLFGHFQRFLLFFGRFDREPHPPGAKFLQPGRKKGKKFLPMCDKIPLTYPGQFPPGSHNGKV
jgi:hypothetical protein